MFGTSNLTTAEIEPVEPSKLGAATDRYRAAAARERELHTQHDALKLALTLSFWS